MGRNNDGEGGLLDKAKDMLGGLTGGGRHSDEHVGAGGGVEDLHPDTAVGRGDMQTDDLGAGRSERDTVAEGGYSEHGERSDSYLNDEEGRGRGGI